MKKEPVQRNFVAFAVILAGGEGRCAEKMGVTRQAVSKWKNREEKEPGCFRRVAYEYVMGLARVSGIPPWILTGCAPDPRFHKEDLPLPTVGKPTRKLKTKSETFAENKN